MKAVWAMAVAALALLTGWVVGEPRSELPSLVGHAAVALGFAWAWSRRGPDSAAWLLGAALALRAALWWSPATPQLSEDWVRYAWDGWVLVQGHWPTGVIPSEWQASPPVPWTPVAESMLNGMNSPDYPGVYPPLAQLLFALPWWLGVRSLTAWWSVHQAFMLLADGAVVAGLAGLLKRWGRSPREAAAYAFHPAVLLEGGANGHLELAVVAAGVMAAWAWPRRQPVTAFGAAAAIGLKWLPVLGLPAWVWARWPERRREGWVWVGLAAAAVGFAGLAWVSMRLFVDRFEFHAGPYYLVRNAVMAFTGHNPIRWLGPLMTAVGGIGVLWAATRKGWTVPQKWAAGWGLWLALATTVHPWYLVYLVPLGLFTPWRWPFWVAGAGVLSYAHYERLPVDGWALGAFWGVVVVAVGWDIWQAKSRKPHRIPVTM